MYFLANTYCQASAKETAYVQKPGLSFRWDNSSYGQFLDSQVDS